MAGRRTDSSDLCDAVARIRQLEHAARHAVATGRVRMLPGNACFLDDGRVLCRDRARGDSRYPYGRDGLHFWVHASGQMYGNRGLFFLFLPFQEDQEQQIAFFVGQRDRAGGTFLPFSLLPTPYVERSEAAVRNRYTVIGHDATWFITETADWTAAVRVFVHQPAPGDVSIGFSVHLTSVADAPLDMYASAYINPFCRHQFGPTSEDRWFKKIEVRSDPKGASLPPFVVSVNEDPSRFRSITNHALVRRRAGAGSGGELVLDSAQVCTSRLGYMGGPRIGLGQAMSLRSGGFERDVPVTVFHDNAVAGDLNRFCLAPRTWLRLDYLLSFPDSGDDLVESMRRPISGRTLDDAHGRVRADVAGAEHDIDLHVDGCRLPGIDDATFNGFVPFLLAQVRVCAETRGYMQPAPNSLIGIRDVFQALEGYLYDRPRAARRKMIEALGFVLVDGRCPRQYSLPVNGQPGRADLREFIDQGVWIVSTVYACLAVTGDAGFLDETVGYHDMTDANETAIAPGAERDSVLEHLLRIMGYLARQRDPATGLVLALYGDWNDALDGLGITAEPGRRFGTGVSVMASLQVYRNCAEIIEILRRCRPGQYAERITELSRVREELRAGLLRYAVHRQDGRHRLVHGWGDNRSYHVGSFRDSDGQARDGLTSNAFWVLCGMLSEPPDLRGDILAAFERLDSPFGLKTFHPGFSPDAPGVGRIPRLPLGTAENGAAYLHATLFGVAALFAMGEPRRAWDQIAKILPFAPHHMELSHSPFVVPNSYVYNRELNLTGQSMNDWQTGSSNVLLKALIRGAIGFLPNFDVLRLAPAAWLPFESYRFAARAHGRRITIHYSRGDLSRRVFRLNGGTVDAVCFDPSTSAWAADVPYDRLRETDENVIEIVDPRDD